MTDSFFQQIHVEEVLSFKQQTQGRTDLICANSLALTIEEVAQLLQKNNILSVPVFDDRTAQPAGIVDVIELMKYTALGDYFRHQSTKSNLPDKHPQNLEHQKDFDKDFEELIFSIGNVGEIVENSERAAKLYIFLKSDPLDVVMKALSERNSSHRILLRHLEPHEELAESEITNNLTYQLISQTDIINYLFHLYQSKKFPESIVRIFETPIENLGLVNSQGAFLVTASSSMRAIDAYKLMTEKEVSAVAIVDDNNKIVANLSASDLRGISGAKLNLLLLPVLEFLHKVAVEDKPLHPIVCSSSSLLKDVLQQLRAAKVHRSWVVNSNQEALSVVSMSDVIACMVGTQKRVGGNHQVLQH